MKVSLQTVTLVGHLKRLQSTIREFVGKRKLMWAGKTEHSKGLHASVVDS